MRPVVLRDGPPAPLLDTVAALWPHAEVRLVHGHARGSDVRAEFALAPSARSPRMAIPVAPAAAAAGAMGRASAATGAGEVATRLAASRFLRVGGVRALADRVQVRGPSDDSLQDHLEESLGLPLVFALGIGTDRVNRKPVLEAFDLRGRRVGFVKVGLGPVARESVTAEAAALQQVRALAGSGIEVPRVLHHSTWRGAPVLVMTSVPTPGAIVDWDRRRIPTSWMRTFDRRFAAPSRRLGDLPWWHDVVERLASVTRRRERRSALECADRLASTATTALPVSAWHGDWTPWNMARHRRGLSLWDWERFEVGVPSGLDVVHYAVNVHTVADGETPAAVARGAARARGHLDLREGEADTVVGAYLAAINARYLPLAEGPGGTAIADRAASFLTAWQEWSGDR
ncbi:phosphotransferase [Nocardioides panacisoli]|uniref:phosphotransferase n=1 Tax=Nocardioides panacisoli TaxID=627624 RepID=UPI001C6264C2|nr:phosphotransferase [Nocardioides panacisoli]QYJ04213.1 phosphotransferase [Nocardioides panacisoli]